MSDESDRVPPRQLSDEVAGCVRELIMSGQVRAKFAPRRFFATSPGWSAASARDHAAIIEAITGRDAGQARAAMTRHLENAGDLLAAALESA